MKHSISIEGDVPLSPALSGSIHSAISCALSCEGISVPCEINVLLTDNQGIREINREYRSIDRYTDVLSFPMFEFCPEHFPSDVSALMDPSGLLPLGDMVISLEKVQAQAVEYGHSAEQELCYLTVHSVLHLLGYDHVDEGTMKRQMRRREKAIMDILKEAQTHRPKEEMETF